MFRSYQFKSRINHLFDIAGKLQDDEIVAAISRHLCILTSGFLENSVKEIILNYVSQKSAPFISSYMVTALQNLSNLKIAKITENISKFNPEWGKQFEKAISDEQRDAIDTIVANRNQIAHGHDVGISLARVKIYFNRTQEVLKEIELIIGN